MSGMLRFIFVLSMMATCHAYTAASGQGEVRAQQQDSSCGDNAAGRYYVYLNCCLDLYNKCENDDNLSFPGMDAPKQKLQKALDEFDPVLAAYENRPSKAYKDELNRLRDAERSALAIKTRDEAHLDNARHNADSTEADLSDAKDKADSAEAACNNAQAAADSAEAACDAIKVRALTRKKKKEEKEQLCAEAASAKSSKEALCAEASSATTTAAALENSIKNIKDEIISLENSIKDREDELISLENSMKTAQDQIISFENSSLENSLQADYFKAKGVKNDAKWNVTVASCFCSLIEDLSCKSQLGSCKQNKNWGRDRFQEGQDMGTRLAKAGLDWSGTSPPSPPMPPSNPPLSPPPPPLPPLPPLPSPPPWEVPQALIDYLASIGIHPGDSRYPKPPRQMHPSEGFALSTDDP